MPVRTHAPETLITHNRLLSLVRYDQDTGDFYWLVRRNSHGGAVNPGDRVIGCIDRYGYRIIGLLGRRYQASRLAWFYAHESWPTGEVDHINRVTLDNRLSNLRDAHRFYQRGNQKAHHDSVTGHKGVSRTRSGKYVARCVRKSLGTFSTIEQARAAYLKEARRVFGEFARSA